MMYNREVQWEIEVTDQFEAWWDQLSEDDRDRVTAAVEILESAGPALGRPLVDTLKGSRLPNMKELRSRGGHLRVLFAFDPRRIAILLLGATRADAGKRGTRTSRQRSSSTTSTSPSCEPKES
jgi:hypothetical protein